MVVDSALDATVAGAVVLQLPSVLLPVVYQSGSVVAFVEVFEDGGEDLGLFVGQGNPLTGRGLSELASTCCLEEGRDAEDVFVGCE